MWFFLSNEIKRNILENWKQPAACMGEKVENLKIKSFLEPWKEEDDEESEEIRDDDYDDDEDDDDYDNDDDNDMMSTMITGIMEEKINE